MNNGELLFNIIKKLESGEMKFLIGERKDHVNFHLDFNSEGISIKVNVAKWKKNSWKKLSEEPYNSEWNNEFKENFYKRKGLENCWYKDCSNKIYQTQGDYKSVNIQCQEKHKRYICLDCYENKYKK